MEKRGERRRGDRQFSVVSSQSSETSTHRALADTLLVLPALSFCLSALRCSPPDNWKLDARGLDTGGGTGDGAQHLTTFNTFDRHQSPFFTRSPTRIIHELRIRRQRVSQ